VHSTGSLVRKIALLRRKLLVCDADLYLGGILGGLRSLLQGHNYSHVLSVLPDSPFKPDATPREYLHIAVYDMEEAGLLEHLPRGIEFIKKGLESGGKVLVHCAAGVSRSATVWPPTYACNDTCMEVS